MLVFWIAVFVISLATLVSGAGLLLKNAEKIGIYLRFPPFVIGTLIVGIGTSLPEFAGALAAVFQGATEIVVANAVGSNITNILLIIGILAIIGRKLTITRDILATELPLFVISTALFLGVVYDAKITILESALLFAAYVIYLLYSLSSKEEVGTVAEELSKKMPRRQRPELHVFLLFAVGIIGVSLGAKFLIDSVITLSGVLGISTGLITITVVALGTSLPELVVSVKALMNNKLEMAVGNIFGSNAFNILMAVGIPGLITTLVVDEITYTIGLPVLGVASFIFLISGISKRIFRWEGMMFLVFYAFFILKLLGL